ncbi:Hypothetical predicted protein [Paramuricea clavata]|uniref:Uncharacterized protein n=1 Tax=Paramuricea clavata TaxID=317549 RepID=A0A6S7JE28_PARCT|nr:Hypothetical predicted protein [Paramuricea clavata]
MELTATIKKMLHDSRSRDQPSTEKDSRTIDADCDHSTNTTLLEDIMLTPDHVAAVLRTLDYDKAYGPDGIPARVLTETASVIAPSLCDLFRQQVTAHWNSTERLGTGQCRSCF